MRGLKIWSILFLAGGLVFAGGPGRSVSGPESGWDGGSAAPVTVEEVKAEFLHAWNAYKEYAWGHDVLKPLSRGFSDWYKEPLLLTPVDALDTMILMGLTAEVQETKELIFSRLSFDRDFKVQHFEIVIRLLGGLLSAYQRDGDPRFLALADDLARRLLPVFNSPTGMPYRFVNLRTGKTSGRVSNPAEIGTCLLEYGVLARLAGKRHYYEKAKAALTALYQRRSATGLVGSAIDVETGLWLSHDSHVGGGIDSYYEYLLKGWLLFGDPDLKAMWETSLTAVNSYLADETTGRLWYGHADMRTGKRSLTAFGALDAFFPGLLALAGDLRRAERLADSCYLMWTRQGVEPELLDYRTMRIIYPPYPLRPEIVESACYLYHFTGDEKYRRRGAAFFRDLVRYCKVESGYAALADVRTKTKADSMESYFLAETLKYFYLLFAPPAEFDFDQVVFNTEAHPFYKTAQPAASSAPSGQTP